MDVEQRIRQMICDEFGLDENEVVLVAELTDDLGISKDDVVDLIKSVEEEFDVEFSERQVENMTSVYELVRTVEGILSAKGK